MKNNSKFLILFLLASCFTFTSCLVDDEVASDTYDQGPNFVGFDVTGTATEAATSVVSDGQEYSAVLKVAVTGPGFTELEGDVTITYEVNEELSTAEENVNFILEDNTITLTNEMNYMGTIPVTILTEGIEAPSSEVLVLDIVEVTTEENVVANGRRDQMFFTINYNCFADLSGTYTVTNSVCPTVSFQATITANPDGSWHIDEADGGLLNYCSTNDIMNPGNIMVICGEVPASQDLYYCIDGYNIGCITGGAWDEDTGTLTLSHIDEFFSWSGGSYTSTYVRN